MHTRAIWLVVAWWLASPALGQELHKLVPSDGMPGDAFGFAAAIDGDLGIVGSPYRDAWRGALYGYDLTTGDELFQLVPHDVEFGDFFAWQVATTPSLIVATSYGDDSPTGVSRVGSVSLYDRTTLLPVGKLFASDGAFWDQLGQSLAVEGDRALVGAMSADPNGASSGAVYLFDLATRTELLDLVPADGAEGDSFGWSVALTEDYAVVAAPFADRQVDGAGAVYVFDAATGAELYQLSPSAAIEEEFFGIRLAVSGNCLAVTSSGESRPRAPLPSLREHTLRLYDLTTGQQVSSVKFGDDAHGASHLYRMAFDGDRVLIGDMTSSAALEYGGDAFVVDAAQELVLGKLFPSDPAPRTWFGSAVALSADYAIIGAQGSGASEVLPGAAYVFDRR